MQWGRQPKALLRSILEHATYLPLSSDFLKMLDHIQKGWLTAVSFSESWQQSTDDFIQNKANLRDLIAATGLVILLKLDSNRRFSARVTLTFDGWPRKTIGHLLCYFKLFASFRSRWWIQTGVTVWKRLIWVKIEEWPCSRFSSIFSPCDIEIWWMTPQKQ